MEYLKKPEQCLCEILSYLVKLRYHFLHWIKEIGNLWMRKVFTYQETSSSICSCNVYTKGIKHYPASLYIMTDQLSFNLGSRKGVEHPGVTCLIHGINTVIRCIARNIPVDYSRLLYISHTKQFHGNKSNLALWQKAKGQKHLKDMSNVRTRKDVILAKLICVEKSPEWQANAAIL